MCKVVYLEPIDYISGKLAKAHDVIFCFRADSGRCYTTIRSERKSEPSEAEKNHRKRFGDARKAALVRAMDANTVEADKTSWQAERRKKGKPYSFEGWLFKEEWKKGLHNINFNLKSN